MFKTFLIWLLEPLYLRLTDYMGHVGMILYGGGKSGSSAPPPDPRLVEAQIKSLGIQDEAVQGVIALQKRMAPIQEEQMRFGLDASRKAFAQSQEDRTYALGRRAALTGVQDAMINEAQDFNTESRREELAGKAAADVNTAFSSAREQSARDLARRGINPASGASTATTNALTIAQAAAGAGASNNARTQARAEGRSLNDRVASTLSGYPTMGMQTTGAGAQFAANGINIANTGASSMSSGFNSAASIAGQMGSNATSMWGSQASYKKDQDNIAGERDGAILGAAATFGGFALGLANVARKPSTA